MLRATLLALLTLGTACAQTCTLTSFPVQVVNGQVVCPGSPPAPAPPTVTWADPASVLVIVQDNTGPEAGTGGMNASQFVANHYMRARGIPAANLLHISTNIETSGGPGCIPGGNCDLTHSDSTNRPLSECQSNVLAPVVAVVAANPKIKYVVPVYGVPVTCYAPNQTPHSLDSILASALLTPAGGNLNPYYDADPASSPPHIDTSSSKVLLVSRLDGPSAVQSAALVDKAIAGETGIHGNGYFDYGQNQPLGPTSLNAYTICKTLVPPQNCILNDQGKTGGMIGAGSATYQSAPMTAFAWGGYDAYNTGPSWNAYSFVPGAVATSMSSNSAQTIRRPTPGAVVYYFLLNGVTGTWGAVGEPYTIYYALGDDLLGHLWRGYTFGESAYISSPVLNWMMVFVGDPLYRPKLT